MSALAASRYGLGRLPVRAHLRPHPPQSVLRPHLVTEDDLSPELLRQHPGLIDELNGCLRHARRAAGQNWRITWISLVEALELPWSGEA